MNCILPAQSLIFTEIIYATETVHDGYAIKWINWGLECKAGNALSLHIRFLPLGRNGGCISFADVLMI
jgi:hypothetical protein